MKITQSWQKNNIFLLLMGVGIILLCSCVENSEVVPRRVFQQSPEQIKGYFGSPISSKTSQNGESVITEITYQPRDLPNVFTKKEFTVSFRNRLAVRIDLNLERLPKGGLGTLPSDESEAKKLTSTLFRYVFGSDANWKLLSQTHPGESLQVKVYCLNPDIATDLIDGQLYLLNIRQESQCH